jgi:hypothetical protein
MSAEGDLETNCPLPVSRTPISRTPNVLRLCNVSKLFDDSSLELALVILRHDFARIAKLLIHFLHGHGVGLSSHIEDFWFIYAIIHGWESITVKGSAGLATVPGIEKRA